MKYSFLLPIYWPRDIDHTIMSIIRQTYRDFELIIVNDASPCDWDQLLEPYMVEECISYHRNPQNIGAADPVALWNHCLQYAQGEFVILCNGFHVYEPEFLEELDTLIEKYPTVNVFGCRKKIINGSSALVDLDGHLSEYATRPDYACCLFERNIYSSIAGYILRREALTALGGYLPFPMGKFTGDATVLSLIGEGIVTSPRLLFSLRINGYRNSVIFDVDVCEQELQAAIDFYYWNQEHIRPGILADKSNLGLLYCHRYGHCLTNYLKCMMGMYVRQDHRTVLTFLRNHRGKPAFITRRWIRHLRYYWFKVRLKTKLMHRFTKHKFSVYDEERLMTFEW